MGSRHRFSYVNQNIDKALDTTNNIIIIRDMNEDLSYHYMHNLKDVLLLNSRLNIIAETLPKLALLDPIILHEDMTPLNQGIIKASSEISDQCAVNVYIPFEYPLPETFTRNALMRKL